MVGEYVLVVDDDPSIRTLVTRLLEDESYETRAAEDGRAALAIVEERTPELVLLDMRMPVMDGWEFARRLRESRGDVPVVVMTAARDAALWAHEIGARGHISKPFDLDDLIRVVRDALVNPDPASDTV